MPMDTIPHRLFDQARQNPNRPAYYVKSGNNWVFTSWKDYAFQVKQAGKAMIALGMNAGGSVCILGYNRPEWVVFDIACMAAGGAPAGIYTTCSAPEVQYIIHHAESPIVLLENKAQWEKVKSQRDKLPHLKHVVMMNHTDPIDDPLVMSWTQFLAHGDKVEDKVFFERMDQIKPNDKATFIYTSGTTGPPKAVMLSHHNLTWTVNSALHNIDIVPGDCSLSYLPLSHIAEQMFSLHVPISVGVPIYFAESIEKVPDNLKEVQPTVFFGVPRIWEKFYEGITSKLKEAPPLRKKIAQWAMGVGQRVNALRNRGKQPTGLLALQYKLANKLVFSKLKPRIGLGRARVCASGAAPIAKEVLEFFAGLDVVVLEVYGQSEGSGPSTINYPGKTKLGSVGVPIHGCEVKIAEDGEILVRGGNVFLGYYKDEAATNETLIDGWLHSGDLGAFDSDGFLSITGRKKEIIITAGGKNIAPKNIEHAIKHHELVGEAVVIGDRRKFLSALITLAPETAQAYAKANGLPAEHLHESAEMQELIEEFIQNEVNPQFARVEQIKKFRILHRPLTIEHGELTPTLKVKRNVVAKNFAQEIESMYQGDED